MLDRKWLLAQIFSVDNRTKSILDLNPTNHNFCGLCYQFNCSDLESPKLQEDKGSQAEEQPAGKVDVVNWFGRNQNWGPSILAVRARPKALESPLPDN